MKPPVFVISLARATDRRESIRALLEADLGKGEYEIVDAVDGATLDIANCHPPVRQDIGDERYCHTLTPGEIAVAISHYNLWARVVAEKIPTALILEDDARWDSNFWDVVTKVTECEWEWDAVLLHRIKRNRGKQVICKLTDTQDLVRHHRLPPRGTAYLVTTAGAEKLCRQFKEIITPFDLMWCDHWDTDMAFYEVMPGVATDSGAKSLIGYRRTKRTLGQTILRKLRKFERQQRRKEYYRTHPPKLRVE